MANARLQKLAQESSGTTLLARGAVHSAWLRADGSEHEYMALTGTKTAREDTAAGCPGLRRNASNSPAYQSAYDTTTHAGTL